MLDLSEDIQDLIIFMMEDFFNRSKKWTFKIGC